MKRQNYENREHLKKKKERKHLDGSNSDPGLRGKGENRANTWVETVTWHSVALMP